MITTQLEIEEPVRTAAPRLIEVAGHLAPPVPEDVAQTGIPEEELSGLLLKIAYLCTQFTTLSIAEQVCLPRSLVEPMLRRLKDDRLLEVLGQDGPMSYRWAITDLGRQRAQRLLEICGYTGPAPVPLQTYNELTDWQCDHLPSVTAREVAAATAHMVIPDQMLEIAGLAAMSCRSLFLYGPPGNGKTTIGHLLHESLTGEIWIPHAIAVGNTVISLFDPQVHQREDLPIDPRLQHEIDHRWVRIRRPLIVAAGELQLADLDASFSDALRYYEAPLQMKSNGGVFLLDDLGYQRVNPFQLLNRWVFPLEHQTDFLTLKTGQKIRVPFRSFLIISTNLDPHSVMEPAIIRRIGYRLFVDNPTAASYTQIFQRCAAKMGATPPPGLIERLLRRHRIENRPLRGCEPRDLLDRAADICRFRDQPLQLNDETLDLAWIGYFGDGNGEDDNDPIRP